jgi:hypothetical protein
MTKQNVIDSRHGRTQTTTPTVHLSIYPLMYVCVYLSAYIPTYLQCWKTLKVVNAGAVQVSLSPAERADLKYAHAVVWVMCVVYAMQDRWHAFATSPATGQTRGG